jgi:hypothetical protein
MRQSRGTDRSFEQRRKLLIETIGRHAFAGHEIERRLRADSQDRRAIRRASPPVTGAASRAFTQGTEPRAD